MSAGDKRISLAVALVVFIHTVVLVNGIGFFQL